VGKVIRNTSIVEERHIKSAFAATDHGHQISLQTPTLKGTSGMNPVRLIAIIIIVAGALGLLYGSFSFTKATHDVKLGPIEFSVKEKETVNVPMWAGIGAIVVGGLLLGFSSKK
jgi:hypothetical protein